MIHTIRRTCNFNHNKHKFNNKKIKKKKKKKKNLQNLFDE